MGAMGRFVEESIFVREGEFHKLQKCNIWHLKTGLQVHKSGSALQ